MTDQVGAQAEVQQRLQGALRGSLLWLFGLVLTLGIFLILSFNLVRGPQVSVTLGEPSSVEVVAPQSTTYNSEVLTERARQQAAASVPDQYTPVDLGIARAQISRVQSITSFVEVVRADTMATEETKLNYLSTIQGLVVDAQVAQDLLSLSASEFATVKEDILRIVEDTMRTGVVEEQLNEARRRAAQGAAFDLTPAQERVVTNLAPQFIVPNVFFDEAATVEAQLAARNRVEPVTQIVTRGERIIRVGDIVDEEDIEMLERLGLREPALDLPRAVATALASLTAVTVLTLYWHHFPSSRTNASRDLLIVGALILLFVLGARLMVTSRSLYSYLFPAAALSILVAVIFDTRLALIVSAVTAGLTGFMAQDSMEMAIYMAAGGMLAVLTLRDTQRINSLFRAGLVAGMGNVAAILIFKLPTNFAPGDLLTALLFGVLNGPIVSASLSLAGIFVIGSLFKVTTSLQLQDLSRLDHPLLQELLRRAPGTYHHSIMVANLAEQAAEQVKANSTLIRVGAFYHDVGKMNRPPFFSENQDGGNPHDNLDPYSSARIIISHVSDGLELARRYRLPNRVREFIAEHHGDRVLRVFYNKARELAEGEEEVDIERFRYSGPRPRSRETGIVQLADAVEATSRAVRPGTEEEIERLVTTLVDEHLREGQLDNSGLSLGDIKLVRESFIKTLKGRYHVRVRYPGNEQLLREPDLEGEADRAAREPAAPEGLLGEATAADPDAEPEVFEPVDEPVPNRG
jgi:cyclic-di-AMP phosphodiesterase PgpH